MSEYLISQFIDDELDLDEKITFVKTVHDSETYADEAVALLDQEKLLQKSAVMVANATRPRKTIRSFLPKILQWWQPLAGFATALILVGVPLLLQPKSDIIAQLKEQRFVVYLPQAQQAEIVGSFTDWTPVPMQKIGSTGYWTLTLELSEGEHRYSYLIGNKEQIVDPTVSSRERDDFGGENSVIVVGGGNEPVS